MTRPIPAHYIRENKNANVPKRVVTIAVEAVESTSRGQKYLTWRCGAAVFLHWTRNGTAIRETRTYLGTADMWADIANFTKVKHRTVVYAHNVPYVMRISQALQRIPDLNFNVEAIRVNQAGSWSRWSRDKASLTICDTASVFPVTVYTLGTLSGLPKNPTPESDDIQPWLDHASHDAAILSRTIESYFNWLREGHAGNWQMTGAGQSWANWRHAHYTHKVLVHADAEAIAAERRAMWTGRAEALQWGRDYDAPIYEWDWKNAYPRIARDCALPYSLAGRTGAVSLRQLRELVSRYNVLADVEVTTDMPVVPARYEGRILWPIGSFTTTLWDPEIDLLIKTGARFTVQRTWLYRRAPVLADWGRWVLGELGFQSEGRPPWLGIVLKHWSRALIGRFATQYQDWEVFGWEPQTDVRMGHLLNADTGELSEFMQIGHEIHQMTGLSESDDSCPQITSYVMSMARNRLFHAVSAVGWQNVYYMDTDSLIVNTAGNARLESLTSQGLFDGLRLKGRYRGYEIYGPRSMVVGPNHVFAGLPKQSQRTGDTSFRGEVWTQMERAIRIGEWDRVSATARQFTVRWNEHRRARCADGRTAAWRLPEHTPERPTGVLPPVTQAEHVQALSKALGASQPADR